MRLWKRKWFVLSDYCLFYYKGESVKSALGRGCSDLAEPPPIHFLINGKP